MKIPVNGLEIPVSNLGAGHRLMCTDGEWRDVEKVDYVYDVDASVISMSYAAVHCAGGHKQLVRDHVYIYNPVPDSSPRGTPSDIPKKKSKVRSRVSSGTTPDTPDDAA